MLRSLALASALAVASLSASALSAQTSAAPSKPSPSAASPAPSVHAKADTGSTSAMNKSTKWTTEQIKEAQEGLAKAGYYKGKPTGQFNADTKKALKHYQKVNKLPVTGRLDSDVLNRLKSA